MGRLKCWRGNQCTRRSHKRYQTLKYTEEKSAILVCWSPSLKYAVLAKEGKKVREKTVKLCLLWPFHLSGKGGFSDSKQIISDPKVISLETPEQSHHPAHSPAWPWPWWPDIPAGGIRLVNVERIIFPQLNGHHAHPIWGWLKSQRCTLNDLFWKDNIISCEDTALPSARPSLDC